MGDVAYPGLTEERQGMGLTDRMKGDLPLDDLADPAVRTTIALPGKGGYRLGATFVTAGRLEERADEAPRRCSCCWRVESHAHHLEDLRRVMLQLSPLRLADLPGRNALPFSIFLGKGNHVPSTTQLAGRRQASRHGFHSSVTILSTYGKGLPARSTATRQSARGTVSDLKSTRSSARVASETATCARISP